MMSLGLYTLSYLGSPVGQVYLYSVVDEVDVPPRCSTYIIARLCPLVSQVACRACRCRRCRRGHLFQCLSVPAPAPWTGAASEPLLPTSRMRGSLRKTCR